jgi:hypothetical protein
MHVDRSRLFHTIVVVGLAAGAAGCGGATKSAGDLDGGDEGAAPDTSAEASGDASPEAGFEFGGGDAGTDAPAPVLFVDADAAAPRCDPAAHQPPCWPTYV